MKTEVVKEASAFVLQGSSYNGEGETVEVSFAELHESEVGDKWVAYDTHNCGRALNEESAEVVYKTADGVAVLFRNWGTTDSPDPQDWANPPELIWYEFA